jgi:hypothetical protein
MVVPNEVANVHDMFNDPSQVTLFRDCDWKPILSPDVPASDEVGSNVDKNNRVASLDKLQYMVWNIAWVGANSKG